MTHDLAASGLRFGIEEEFFLLDASDLDIVRSAPPDSSRPAATRSASISPRRCSNARSRWPARCSPPWPRRALPRAGPATPGASGHGLRPALALRRHHPFADWRRARSNPAAHFARLFEDQGGWPGAAWSAACTCMWRYRRATTAWPCSSALPWLPLLLALSASSPFHGGRRSGLASYRRALCGEWPRMNIPPALPDEDAYRRHLALREAGCIREDGQVWWMIRPSSHVPTWSCVSATPARAWPTR